MFKPSAWSEELHFYSVANCLVPVQSTCCSSENERHFSKAYMVIFKVTYSVLLFSRPPSNEHDGAITRCAKLAGWRRTAESIFCWAADSPSYESRTPRPSESALLYWFVTLYQLFFKSALLRTFCTCDKTGVVLFFFGALDSYSTRQISIVVFIWPFQKLRRSTSGMEENTERRKILWRENLKDLANFDDEYPAKLGFIVQVPAL